jgi:guanylate kinase
MNAIPKPAVRPLLIVISAPSGGGKTTLCERLLADHPGMTYSISCTTRVPRGREVDGEDYHFLSERDFRHRLKAGHFLEHACVHGFHYGTLRKPVVTALQAGRDVVMDIDVQGAAQVRRLARDGTDGRLRRAYVDIFVVPPSLDVLRQRLDRRREDAPAAIARRMRNAVLEMRHWREYRYLIVNDELKAAYRQLCAVLAAERCRIV